MYCFSGALHASGDVAATHSRSLMKKLLSISGAASASTLVMTVLLQIAPDEQRPLQLVERSTIARRSFRSSIVGGSASPWKTLRPIESRRSWQRLLLHGSGRMICV